MRNQVFEWRPPEPRYPQESWSDDIVVGCTLAVYQECVDPTFEVIGRPDRSDHVNPTVDAIFAAASGLQIAVEVTSVETFAHQYETRSRVRDYLEPFEKELASRLRSGVWCELPVHPLSPGHDWNAVGRSLVAYILEVEGSLEAGASCHVVTGLPFDVWLGYDPNFPLPFRFTQASPSAAEIHNQLVVTISERLRHKKPELRTFRENGYRTVLVLTSDDPNFYRITWHSAHRAFLEADAAEGSEHVNDVLFTFTGDCSSLYALAFKSDHHLCEALNTATMTFVVAR